MATALSIVLFYIWVPITLLVACLILIPFERSVRGLVNKVDSHSLACHSRLCKFFATKIPGLELYLEDAGWFTARTYAYRHNHKCVEMRVHHLWSEDALTGSLAVFIVVVYYVVMLTLFYPVFASYCLVVFLFVVCGTICEILQENYLRGLENEN